MTLDSVSSVLLLQDGGVPIRPEPSRRRRRGKQLSHIISTFSSGATEISLSSSPPSMTLSPDEAVQSCSAANPGSARLVSLTNSRPMPIARDASGVGSMLGRRRRAGLMALNAVIEPGEYSASTAGGAASFHACIVCRAGQPERPDLGFWRAQFISQGSSDIPDGTLVDNPLVEWHGDGTEIMNSTRALLPKVSAWGCGTRPGRSVTS